MFRAGYPWKVYASSGYWMGDTMLRVECGEEEDCCEVVMVNSQVRRRGGSRRMR